MQLYILLDELGNYFVSIGDNNILGILVGYNSR
jgi:hypothetical protein